MDFQDFPMILGNLGVETDHPYKMCAGLGTSTPAQRTGPAPSPRPRPRAASGGPAYGPREEPQPWRHDASLGEAIKCSVGRYLGFSNLSPFSVTCDYLRTPIVEALKR